MRECSIKHNPVSPYGVGRICQYFGSRRLRAKMDLVPHVFVAYSVAAIGLIAYMPASLVSVTTLGEPIGSVILAFFILGEFPSALTLLGGALILAGIYLASISRNSH